MSVALKVLQGVFGANQVHTALPPHPASAVVFFPGDRVLAAGLPELIVRLQDPQHLAALLAAKFPTPQVFIVMPSRYEASFSCYDHFLNKLTLSGEPLGYLGAGLRAARQLASLLRGASWDTTLPCHLVGFSKGGVVLNQILVELAELAAGPAGQGRGGSPGGATPHLHQPPEAAEEGAIALLRSLQQIHFLDCGLNCRGAYLTDPEAVQRLGAWCRQHPQLRLFVHGTPRQWDDPRRPWIPLEKNRFAALCAEAGVPLQQRKYCEGQRPSLEQHFRVVQDFAGVAGKSGR